METVKCEIVKDMLPLYIDGVVSNETKDVVEEHLEHCSKCKKIYDEMSKELPQLGNDDVSVEDAEQIKKLKKKIFRKSVINVLLGVAIGAVLLSLIVFGWYTVQALKGPYVSKEHGTTVTAYGQAGICNQLTKYMENAWDIGNAKSYGDMEFKMEELPSDKDEDYMIVTVKCNLQTKGMFPVFYGYEDFTYNEEKYGKNVVAQNIPYGEYEDVLSGEHNDQVAEFYIYTGDLTEDGIMDFMSGVSVKLFWTDIFGNNHQQTIKYSDFEYFIVK